MARRLKVSDPCAMFRSIVKTRLFARPSTISRRWLQTAGGPGVVQNSSTEQARLKLLFFANKHNSLSQRIALALENQNHEVHVHEVSNPDSMIHVARSTKPDLIVCPFLTKRVPEAIYSNPDTPCLIVHPGIEGDRGMSSLDWALKERQPEWGVTVLQADEEMDVGDIWSSTNFPIKRPDENTLTKSSLYVHEVTDAATKGVLEALENFRKNKPPRPLDYSNPKVRGSLKPNMKKVDRMLDWNLAADEVALQVRMSDSSPGAVARLHLRKDGDGVWTEEFRVFGAHLERGDVRNVRGTPGDVIGHRDNAVLVMCGEGAVWLSHVKKSKLKLPATYWLNGTVERLPTLPHPAIEIAHGSFPDTFQEIWTSVTPEGVCHVNFNFYNGAMNTGQCRRLEAALEQIERDDRCKVVILKGGYNFFSNGIHLNTIESAPDQAEESWQNINAINDVVRRVFQSRKVVVSALRGNAGAGGLMLALASDVVVAREGVVLNPHYKLMNLYGSEYHTYFLQERVGQHKAQELLHKAQPISSSQAVKIGLLDAEMGQDVAEFEQEVRELGSTLATPSVRKIFSQSKQKKSSRDFFEMVTEHRASELEIMRKNFQDPAYHTARKAFVYH